MSKLDRWLRPTHRAACRHVAGVATPSTFGSDDETTENKLKFTDVAVVAAVAGGQDLKNPIRPAGRRNFQNQTPAKAATCATNGNLAYKANGLDVTALPGQSGDSGDSSTDLDFETRNTDGCKLKEAGAWRYAADHATEILTLTYQNGDGEPRLWTPTMATHELATLAADPAVTFTCYGDFELAVWNRIMVARHGLPPIPISRWDNVQATCSYLALPRALDKTLTVIGSEVVKDAAGRRLVLSLSRPYRKSGAFPEVTPAILERVSAYNRIDVAGLAAIRTAVGTLPERERRVWELDQTINQRGVHIDMGFVHAAQRFTEKIKKALEREFAALTVDFEEKGNE